MYNVLDTVELKFTEIFSEVYFVLKGPREDMFALPIKIKVYII
jgi:hypothetical protein